MRVRRRIATIRSTRLSTQNKRLDIGYGSIGIQTVGIAILLLEYTSLFGGCSAKAGYENDIQKSAKKHA